MFLPHTRNPDEDWKALDFGLPSHIFLHGTITGAVAETGMKMEGISSDWFKGLRATILAGDIHVPQKIGNVEYVGAPYPIRFGDTFQGRALVLMDGKKIDCPLANIRKLTVYYGSGGEKESKIDQKFLTKGDHVKVVVQLSDSELGEFQDLKRLAAKNAELHHAVLCKVQLERLSETTASKKPKLKLKVRTPEESLVQFCKSTNVERELEDLGKQLLKEDS